MEDVGEERSRESPPSVSYIEPQLSLLRLKLLHLEIFSKANISGHSWKLKDYMFSVPLVVNGEDFDFRYLLR